MTIMTTITQLQGALIADLAYDNLSSKVDILNRTEDDAGNKYTTRAFYSSTSSDLQMALLEDKNGRKFVAFRGTDSFTDFLVDIHLGISVFLGGVSGQFIDAGVVLSRWINDFSLSSGDTTIVGHSLGGALAQYFGANTGFETLTYNAYGIGRKLSGGSNSNITNYVTMHDPVSVLPGSQMVGTTYMLQDEKLHGVLGHGISNFTSPDNWIRGYSLVNSPSDIDVILNGYYEADEQRLYAQINGSKQIHPCA